VSSNAVNTNKKLAKLNAGKNFLKIINNNTFMREKFNYFLRETKNIEIPQWKGPNSQYQGNNPGGAYGQNQNHPSHSKNGMANQNNYNNYNKDKNYSNNNNNNNNNGSNNKKSWDGSHERRNGQNDKDPSKVNISTH
jgi:hypothetical protein